MADKTESTPRILTGPGGEKLVKDIWRKPLEGEWILTPITHIPRKAEINYCTPFWVLRLAKPEEVEAAAGFETPPELWCCYKPERDPRIPHRCKNCGKDYQGVAPAVAEETQPGTRPKIPAGFVPRSVLDALKDLVRVIRDGQCGDYSPAMDEIFDAEAEIREAEGPCAVCGNPLDDEVHIRTTKLVVKGKPNANHAFIPGAAPSPAGEPNLNVPHEPDCDCEVCFYEARQSGRPDPKGGRRLSAPFVPKVKCKHSDPFCPCNDGDSCNHEPASPAGEERGAIEPNPITYRMLHEEAAGMGLCEEFFTVSGINPNAPVACNCNFDAGHEPSCDIVAAHKLRNKAASPHARDGVPGPVCPKCGKFNMSQVCETPAQMRVTCYTPGCGFTDYCRGLADFRQFFPAPSVNHLANNLLIADAEVLRQRGVIEMLTLKLNEPKAWAEEMAGKVVDALIAADYHGDCEADNEFTRARMLPLVLSVLKGGEGKEPR